MGVREVEIEGVRLRLLRLSFSGELAYELYAPADRVVALWERLLARAAPLGIKPYGLEALASLRIEKGHVAGLELDHRNTLDDLGLGKMAASGKAYVGRELRDRPDLRAAERWSLVGLELLEPQARLRGGAIYLPAAMRSPATDAGYITSVTWSTVLEKYIALGLYQGGLEHVGEEILCAYPLKGETVRARIVQPVFVDPGRGAAACLIVVSPLEGRLAVGGRDGADGACARCASRRSGGWYLTQLGVFRDGAERALAARPPDHRLGTPRLEWGGDAERSPSPVSDRRRPVLGDIARGRHGAGALEQASAAGFGYGHGAVGRADLPAARRYRGGRCARASSGPRFGFDAISGRGVLHRPASHHTGMLLDRRGRERFELYVLGTFAASIWDVLIDTALPYGYEVGVQSAAAGWSDSPMAQ